MRHLKRLSEIAGSYDGYVVDLWGVVHNGVRPLPGATDCLTAMRAAGKRIVLLSNAPRRAATVAAQLDAMGIGSGLYDGLVTSGEITHQLLDAWRDPFLAAVGPRTYVIGPERDRDLYEATRVVRAERLDEADLILNSGPEDERPEAIGQFDPILRLGAARAVPMLCANPDLEVIRGDTRVICAGALAARYLEMGGAVKLIGKPDPFIYEAVLARLGTERARTVAIGDALATDMRGAAAAGLDGLWVLGGIHRELHDRPDEAAALAASASLTPVASLPSLVW